MKLTPEILSSKLGKSLEVLDLSLNRFQLLRHIKGLFDLPAIKDLNLSGNPVAKSNGYRSTVIASLPTLQILDGKKITGEERNQSTTDIPTKDPLLNTDADEEEDEEEEVVSVKEPEPPKAVPVAVAPVVQEAPKPVVVVAAAPVVQEAPKPTPTPAVVAQPAPVPVAVAKPKISKLEKDLQKKAIIDEDSLFAPKEKKTLEFGVDGDDSLFGDVGEDLSSFEKKPKAQAAPAKKSSIVFMGDDDDDDIFGKKPSKPSSAASSNDLDDDLFSSFSSTKEKGALSNDFDMSSYIEAQKNRTKGGLFD
eukprot:gene11963-13945_t